MRNYESENNSFSDSFSFIIPDKLQRNCNPDSTGIGINTALRGMIHRAFDNSSSPLMGDSSFNLHCFMARGQIEVSCGPPSPKLLGGKTNSAGA